MLTRFGTSIERLHVRSLALHKYFSVEVEQDAYFKIVPADSVQQVGEALEEVVYQLGQLIISLPGEARPEVIDRESRRRVWEALRALVQAAEIVQEQCPDQETVECFRRVQETSETVRSSHFATPTPDAVPGPPDQEAPIESDAPQERDIAEPDD